MPDLVHTHPTETVAEAIAILQEYGVSQMPVVRAEPPVMAAEVAGLGLRARAARRALRRRGASSPTRSSSTWSRRCRPWAPARPVAARRWSSCEVADAVLVQEDGRPVGVLTRQDLLSFVGRD